MPPLLPRLLPVTGRLSLLPDQRHRARPCSTVTTVLHHIIHPSLRRTATIVESPSDLPLYAVLRVSDGTQSLPWHHNRTTPYLVQDESCIPSEPLTRLFRGLIHSIRSASLCPWSMQRPTQLSARGSAATNHASVLQKICTHGGAGEAVASVHVDPLQVAQPQYLSQLLMLCVDAVGMQGPQLHDCSRLRQEDGIGEAGSVHPWPNKEAHVSQEPQLQPPSQPTHSPISKEHRRNRGNQVAGSSRCSSTWRTW